MPCAECPHGIKALFSWKLGRCYACIRSSMLGALLLWAGYLIVKSIYPSSPLEIASLVSASAFTALAVSHIGAYTIRLGLSLRRTEEENQSMVHEGSSSPGRRKFLGLMTRGALAAT